MQRPRAIDVCQKEYYNWARPPLVWAENGLGEDKTLGSKVPGPREVLDGLCGPCKGGDEGGEVDL